MLLFLFVPRKNLASLGLYSAQFTSTEAGQGNTQSCILAQLNRTELRSSGSGHGVSEQCGGQGRAMHSKELRTPEHN